MSGPHTSCSPRSSAVSVRTAPMSIVTVSVLLNLILLAGWMWPYLDRVTCLHNTGLGAEPPSRQQQPPAGWSRLAAEAAEAAASFNCSGNGDVYIDTVDDSDTIQSVDFWAPHNELISCECYECFTGPQCADLVPDCDANVQSGDPLLFAPFWKQNAEESAVLIPGWYRMGYVTVEASSSALLTPALEREIRSLHTLVGNAVVDNKYIVIGDGTTLLLNAAVASLSPTTGNPASVVAATPYYQAYRDQTQLLETSHYVWAGDANVYAEQQSTLNESSIEFVTSPNNPDTAIRTAILNGSSASTIYDLVYYWPHFTAITTTLDHDVMLFSLSKITGHAGSRLGWAILKDYSVYTRMLKQVVYSVVAVSHESQLRATQLLRSINKAYSIHLRGKQNIPMNLPPSYYASKGLSFHYAHAILRYRWNKLSSTLEASQQLELQQVDSNYCNFFKEVTDPSPAYAWVHCKQGNDEECQSLFIQAGILVRNGSLYGASNRYARFSLIKRDSTFENLVEHLSMLASKEMMDKPSDLNAIS